MKKYILFNLLVTALFSMAAFFLGKLQSKYFVLFFTILVIVGLFAFLYYKSNNQRDSKKQVFYSLGAIGLKFNLMLFFVIIWQFTVKLEVIDAIILLLEYALLMLGFYLFIAKKGKEKEGITS